MADRNNESLLLDQEVYGGAIDTSDAIESNRHAKKKRKQFTSIVSIEGNEFVDVAAISYRIVQNAFKRQKIEIVRVDSIHASSEEMRSQIDALKATLAVEKNLVQALK